MKSNTVFKKLSKVGNPVHQEPNVSANDLESSGASNKDAKMVLPQPTVQQPQQTQMKKLNPRQHHHQLTSPRTPLPVVAPVEAPKAVEFKTLDEDINNIFNGMLNIADIREDSGDKNSMFNGLFHTDGEKDFQDEHEDFLKTDGFNADLYEPKLTTKPLAMPLGTGGSSKNGGGGKQQNVDKVLAGVSQRSIISERTNVLPGLLDSNTIKPKKTGKLVQPLDSKPDVISQFKNLHLGGGANGLPTDDTSGKDQKSRCSKDVKTAPLQKASQKLRSMSPNKMPLKICEDEGTGDESSMFGILFGDDDKEGVDIQDYDFSTDMREPKMITTPLAMPLGTGNSEKKDGSGGGKERQIVGTHRSSELPDVYELEIPCLDTLSEEQTLEPKFLESILDGRKKPCHLNLTLLKLITNNFSYESKIGHGGCGEVYKGILSNGIVAVKRLFQRHTLEDKMFHQEVGSLMMVEHKNVVKFLGFCSHTQEQAIKMSGNFVAEARERIVLAQTRERLLCFEYISNGNLEKHLTDELRGLEWHTRYQIIKGICEGLNHLTERGIVHMDLKPGNILIDDHMVPKITDFGLSRFDDISQTMSADRLVSWGYCAPEYIEDGKISSKVDIYSLGKIIIEMVTGCKKEPNIIHVLRRWRHRWSKLPKHTLLWYHQVSKCLELALRCIQKDPKRRPSICEIIQGLNEIDINYETIRIATESTFAQLISHCLRGVLGVDPLEIHFSFTPGKNIWSSSIQLTNNTDDYIGFMVSSTSPLSYSTQPNKGIIPPRDKGDVTLTLQQAQEKAELHIDHCRDEFCVQSIRIHESLSTMNVTEDMFHVEDSKDVDEVNLTVVFDPPPPTHAEP